MVSFGAQCLQVPQQLLLRLTAPLNHILQLLLFFRAFNNCAAVKGQYEAGQPKRRCTAVVYTKVDGSPEARKMHAQEDLRAGPRCCDAHLSTRLALQILLCTIGRPACISLPAPGLHVLRCRAW